jgi:hypothetical protein
MIGLTELDELNKTRTLLMCGEPVTHSVYRYLRGLLNRITVHASTDGRKRDTAGAVLKREVKASRITGAKEGSLTLLSTTINRPYGVKNKARGQTTSAGYDRAAGWAVPDVGPDLVELAHDLWTSRAMDSAIDPAAAGKR